MALASGVPRSGPRLRIKLRSSAGAGAPGGRALQVLGSAEVRWIYSVTTSRTAWDRAGG